MSALLGGASPGAPAASARRLDSGLIVATFRRRCLVDLGSGGRIECLLKGRGMTPACGDQVKVEHDNRSGVVIDIDPRTSLLYRSDSWHEKLVAANVTQVIALVAPDVPVDEHLLNRWIIAAEAERCHFVLAVNKVDLPGSDRFVARFSPYRTLGYPVIAVSALNDAAPLAPWMVGQHSVMIGQSGMGKSSLINALAPNAAAPTGDVSTALRSGRHTTSSAILYHLGPPNGDDRGWIIDSPGMTLFGLAHYAAAAIEHAFVELRGISAACRFRNCRHDQEPGCAVTQSLRDGRIAPQRAALLRTLLNESQAVARAMHRR